MKIMVPLSSAELLTNICSAGADELYFGFWDDEWNRKFGIYEEINRMSSFGAKANIPYDQIFNVISQIHQLNKKAYITLNSPVYSSRELKELCHIIKKNKMDTADGFIIGDFSVIGALAEFDVPVTLSTMAGIYNSNILDFYYSLGIRRVILPRDVSINDMSLIVNKYPDVEFEVFFMRNGCKYSDSNCLSFHSRNCGTMCAELDEYSGNLHFSENTNMGFKKEAYENNKLFTKAFHKTTCGLCSLKKLNEIGISTLKIVGRADMPAEIIKDIELVKSYINGNITENYDNCLYGLNCYYPDL